MDLYTIDVETYYSSREEYSLRKMPMVSYIMDDRFELISLSYMKNTDPPVFLFGEEAERWLEELDSERVGMLAQNTQFDAAVLAWRYGKRFAFYFDTLAMARPVVRPFTRNGRISLAALTEHFGFKPKGGFVHQMNGVHLADITDEQRAKLKEYNNHDVVLARLIFEILRANFPPSELLLIDQIVRMYIEPRLGLRADILCNALQKIRDDKARLLEEAGLSDASLLMSNNKFSGVLGLLLGGMDKVPRKLSLRTGKMTWAFSKKDKAFTDLLEHENQHVATIVAARLGHKSTLLETRTKKLLGIAEKHGSLAVPLLYWGAHTGRLSGGGGLNLQNLTRGSQLRDAIVPLEKDEVLVVVDASQIEARFLATWAGQWNVVRQFANKEDVYALFASKLYGRAIHKDLDRDERFVGKVAVLSLGYGSGTETFWQMLWSSRTPEQIAAGFEVDMLIAERVVAIYRHEHEAITDLWREADRKMLQALRPGGLEYETGPFYFEPGKMTLPNGMPIYYPDLRREEVYDDNGQVVDQRWYYGEGSMKKTLYGPKIVENATQAATRIIITDAWLELKKRWPIALQVHDELVFVVKSHEAEKCLETAIEVLSRPPEWMPDIPLAAEGKIGKSYGGAK